VAGVALLLLAVREAAALFAFYRAQARLPLWDPAEHAWQAFVLARDLQDGEIVRFLVHLNRQDTWPFGYSLLVAPFLLLGGFDYAAATLSSVVLFALVPVLLLAVARELDEGPAGVAAGLLAGGLFLASPLFRLYAILIMRELAGVALTLLALACYLRALRRGSLAAYRAAGLATLALFFVKYNYAVLWLLGVLVHQLGRQPAATRVALARRAAALAWPWPTRDPRRVAPACVLYTLGLLALVGRGLGQALYALLVGATAVCVWRLWRHGAVVVRARWRALPPPARALLETLVVPLWLWALSPSPLHVRKLVSFLVSRPTEGPLAFLGSPAFYARSFVQEYAFDWSLGAAVLVAAGAAAAGLWRAGEPARVLILVAGVQVAAVMLHPYQQARFLATAAPPLMLLAALGTARAAARLAGAARGWLVAGAAGAAALALLLAWLPRTAPTERLAARYVEQSAEPALAAPLRYLDEQAPREGRVAIIGAFGELSPNLIRWTLARTRDVRRFGVARSAGRVAADAPSERVRQALAEWVDRRPPDRILGIRVLPSSPYFPTEDFQRYNAWQARLLDELGADRRWRQAEGRRFPESGLEVLVFVPATPG
jgi:hypothetical protein